MTVRTVGWILTLLAIVMSILLIYLMVDTIRMTLYFRDIAPCNEYIAVPLNTCTDNWWQSFIKSF